MGNNNGTGRWIGAVIIAAIGFMMYLSHVQQNPVTGEKQHVSLSPDQEIHLGLQSAPVMAQKMGGELSDTDPHSVEVKKIGTYLAGHTIAKISPWKFEFHVIADDKTINAFALPGGQIFITMGLLERLQTEAQLAGVLGHEMGHVIERHSAQQMAKSELGQSIIQAVNIGTWDPNHPEYSMTASMIASMVNHMMELRYSRKDESQADIWGLKLMSQANYDPRAMIQVLEILMEAGDKGHSIEMFQTHPHPETRIINIKNYFRENPPEENSNEGRNLKEVFGNLRVRHGSR